MRLRSASRARLKRSERVRRRLHSLLKAPIRTAAPSRRSEKELALPRRMTTCLFRDSRAPVTYARVTLSAKGTVCDVSELGTGVGEPSSLAAAGVGIVGGPLG